MKKIIIALMVSITMVLGSSTVYAHSHTKSVKTNTKLSYNICTIEDCTLTGTHKHNNISYVSHYYGDGHDYHDICSLQDCLVTGYHEHNGTYHFAHTTNDGHTYHNSGNQYIGGHH